MGYDKVDIRKRTPLTPQDLAISLLTGDVDLATVKADYTTMAQVRKCLAEIRANSGDLLLRLSPPTIPEYKNIR